MISRAEFVEARRVDGEFELVFAWRGRLASARVARHGRATARFPHANSELGESFDDHTADAVLVEEANRRLAEYAGFFEWITFRQEAH